MGNHLDAFDIMRRDEQIAGLLSPVGGTIVTYRTAWDDPAVKAALMERHAEDISLILCKQCLNYSYYNDGSHWECSVPGCGGCLGDLELSIVIEDGEVLSLDDYNSMMAYPDQFDPSLTADDLEPDGLNPEGGA